jgi:hypothetical protein
MSRSLQMSILAVCCFLAGCDGSAVLKKFAPVEIEAADKHYVDLLRQKNFQEIQNHLDANLINDKTPEALAKMAALFPNDPPKSVKLVGAHNWSQHNFNGSGFSTVDLVFEYEFSHTWILVEIITRTRDAVTNVIGFHVNTIPDSLENQNRFTFKGKGRMQYFALVLAVAVLLFSLYVLVLCVRTSGVPWKWLWIIFILFGMGQFSVNWTTGEYGANLIRFQIPCAMATAQFFGPWIISIVLPVGAITFLIWREAHVRPRQSNGLPSNTQAWPPNPAQ